MNHLYSFRWYFVILSSVLSNYVEFDVIKISGQDHIMCINLIDDKLTTISPIHNFNFFFAKGVITYLYQKDKYQSGLQEPPHPENIQCWKLLFCFWKLISVNLYIESPTASDLVCGLSGYLRERERKAFLKNQKFTSRIFLHQTSR